MANLNRVLLIGNLTRDPEIRYTPKGTAVADIALAVNRVFTGEDGEKREEVTYVDVVVWSRLAEIAEQYLKKGRPVFIEGRLQLDSWDDKQTGQKRSRLRVGVGAAADQADLVDHVLSSFSKTESAVIDRSVERATEAIRKVVDEGVETAMNLFNRAE